MDKTIPDRRQPQTVFAIFREREEAGAAIGALQQQGFPPEQISAALRHDQAEVTPEEIEIIDQEAEATGAGVAVGGTAGGLVGFLGGLALSAIPGIGPFFGLGVLVTTLGGAAVGSALGERLAELGQLGVPEERTHRYGEALEAGHVMVAVSANDADEVIRAREALALHHADEIEVYTRPDEKQPAPNNMA
jgi:hypothetical protein